MKKFWPNRSEVKGFSIQKLACKYGFKSSLHSVSCNEASKKLLDDSNLISIKEEVKSISISNLSIKRMHWANRDFSEYKEAA